MWRALTTSTTEPHLFQISWFLGVMCWRFHLFTALCSVKPSCSMHTQHDPSHTVTRPKVYCICFSSHPSTLAILRACMRSHGQLKHHAVHLEDVLINSHETERGMQHSQTPNGCQLCYICYSRKEGNIKFTFNGNWWHWHCHLLRVEKQLIWENPTAWSKNGCSWFKTTQLLEIHTINKCSLFT